jgi:hypothetical protein
LLSALVIKITITQRHMDLIVSFQKLSVEITSCVFSIISEIALFEQKIRHFLKISF